jgi:hypothetical protein
MLRTNLTCIIRQKDGTDVYGLPLHGKRKKEACAVVKRILRNDKTSVRADSSASRGNARELEADIIILLTPNTTAEIDAIIDFAGDTFSVKSMHQRYDIKGKLDHFEVGCTYYSDSETET